MRWFWHTVVRQFLEALRPKAIIEVGSEDGHVTFPLLEWADAHAAVVHVIDPAPRFDVDAARAAHPHSLRFHRARSLRVLPQIPTADLVLIDGDHNWHTVISELRQLERRAARDVRLPGVILLHDVEWPYARRDLYYDPQTIPSSHRHEYAQRGIVPGDGESGGVGLNSAYHNAAHEGGPANGVLTAVEDFLAESELRWTFATVPGMFGLGILVPARLASRRPVLRRVLELTQTPEFLREQCRTLEQARIGALLRAVELESRLPAPSGDVAQGSVGS
jgi:hypothetical protein